MFGRTPFGSSFGDLFRDVEKEFDRMDRRFEQLREAAKKQHKGDGPMVYGWTMNIGPDGVPRIQRFGNVGDSEGELEEGWREPFVTSFLDEDKNLVRFTAELPGVQKENIDIEAFDSGLKLEATGTDRRYKTTVPVDHLLDPATADASYNNGILEVAIELAEPIKPEGKKVDVR